MHLSIIINNENVVWLVETLKNKWCFNALIVDESSAYKSQKAKRFKALRLVRKYFNRVVLLTGTPTPKNLEDLYSQIFLLDSGQRLGKTLTQYRYKYFVPDKCNGLQIYSWKIRDDNAEKEIHKAISDICMSLKKDGIVKMTELVEKIIKVVLSDDVQKLVNDFQKNYVLQLKDKDITAKTASVLSNKLLQLANGAVYDENGMYATIHDAKIKALKKYVEEQNDNILVFYQYKHDAERIRRVLPYAVEYNGEKELKAWNNGQIKVLLAHPASVGYGLNLQKGGHKIVWFGLTYNLEYYQQAIARLHRQGQEHDVEVVYLITKNTLDERLLPLLQKKAITQNTLLNAIKMQIKEV